MRRPHGAIDMTTSFDMQWRGLRLWSLGLVALLSACAAATSPPDASFVTGTATYRERMALPPGAVFEARIEDVSWADAPSTVVGSTRVDSPSVPVEFSIPYDINRIDPRGRYVVRARIT